MAEKDYKKLYETEVDVNKDLKAANEQLAKDLDEAKKTIEISIPKEKLDEAIEEAKKAVQKDLDDNYTANSVVESDYVKKDSLAETHVEKSVHDDVVAKLEDADKKIEGMESENKTVELTEENEKLKAEVARLNAGKIQPSHVKILDFSGEKKRVKLLDDNRTSWEHCGFVWHMPKSEEREFDCPVEIIERVKGKGILEVVK